MKQLSNWDIWDWTVAAIIAALVVFFVWAYISDKLYKRQYNKDHTRVIPLEDHVLGEKARGIIEPDFYGFKVSLQVPREGKPGKWETLKSYRIDSLVKDPPGFEKEVLDTIAAAVSAVKESRKSIQSRQAFFDKYPQA